jgi:predicted HD superfamily hydrolase involved in NAD metabolism
MIEPLRERLEELYKDKPERLRHVYGVVEMALYLQSRFGGDKDKIEIAALMHDITKYMNQETHMDLIKGYYDFSEDLFNELPFPLWHAYSAVAYIAEEFGIKDKTIEGAIECHTMGCEHMSIEAMIVFVSDYIEKNRTYESSVSLREQAGILSLESLVYHVSDESIKHYEKDGRHIPRQAYLTRAYYKGVLT